MNETTPVIEATQVRRTYRGRNAKELFEAVRGVDLTVKQGEVFALLGTNGAGKTSLMEILEGLSTASDGRVRVFGHDPFTERHKVRPRTGVVLQESAFPADLKVAEVASTWAQTLSNPLAVEEVLERVELSHRASVATASLSGGERRRLDLALAILGKPELLFLDEPTTGLDPESRRTTWEIVRGLVDGGTTVLLTTHYLEEAEQLADRIAVMNGGQIVREGSPAELVAGEPGRIEFTLPTDERLPALHGDHVALRSHGIVRHTVTTHSLEDDLRRLLVWAHESNLSLGGLDARSGSLEQLFLDIARSSDAQPVLTDQEVPA